MNTEPTSSPVRLHTVSACRRALGVQQQMLRDTLLRVHHRADDPARAIVRARTNHLFPDDVRPNYRIITPFQSLDTAHVNTPTAQLQLHRASTWGALELSYFGACTTVEGIDGFAEACVSQGGGMGYICTATTSTAVSTPENSSTHLAVFPAARYAELRSAKATNPLMEHFKEQHGRNLISWVQFFIQPYGVLHPGSCWRVWKNSTASLLTRSEYRQVLSMLVQHGVCANVPWQWELMTMPRPAPSHAALLNGPAAVSVKRAAPAKRRADQRQEQPLRRSERLKAKRAHRIPGEAPLPPIANTTLEEKIVGWHTTVEQQPQ